MKRKRQRQLDAAVWSIHRRFGSQSLVRGTPAAAGNVPGRVPHVSTGFQALDDALGSGGLPRGSLCELLGPATSGKTTIALKFLAQAQTHGRHVAYVDQSGHFDPDYAYRCGLDLSRLWIARPADLREGLATVEALARDGSLAAIVLDAADFFWDDPGAAGQLAAMVGRLAAPLARSETILLVLHEAEATSTSPLSALAHAAAVRLRTSRERWLRAAGLPRSRHGGERGGDVRGYEARVEVLKNRLGSAGRSVKLAIEFNGTVRAGDGL